MEGGLGLMGMEGVVEWGWFVDDCDDQRCGGTDRGLGDGEMWMDEDGVEII
jgi:hypothetical protein